MKWKNSRGLMTEGNGQIVRLLRPKEVEAIFENLDIGNEGNKSRNWLQSRGITTEDVRIWLKTALFTGCRFGELVVIHEDPSLLFGTNKLRIPNYFGSKRKRKTKFRNIALSNMGSEVLPQFFNARQLPSGSKKEVTQTLVSLTQMLHASAREIGLPEYTFTLQIASGPTYKDEKGKEHKEFVPKEYTTDGVCFRSFRKTWESWLMLSFANNYSDHMKLVSQMGHDLATSMKFYTTVLSGYDEEDRRDIFPWVDGVKLVE